MNKGLGSNHLKQYEVTLQAAVLSTCSSHARKVVNRTQSTVLQSAEANVTSWLQSQQGKARYKYPTN
jgi:uncharacterized protein YcfL